MQLKELRQNKQLTLEEVSKGTGLSMSMICKLERGDVKLTHKVEAILTHYYKCEIECPSSTIERKIAKLEAENNQLKNDCAKLLNQNLELRRLLKNVKTIVEQFPVEVLK